MKPQISQEVRKERSRILRGEFHKLAWDFRQRFIGQKLAVLWESVDQLSERGWQMEGYTDNYIRVKTEAPEPRWNQLDGVELTRNDDDGMQGVIR
jgi:tRNA A37 methylthiotransferase MiaB